jgi:hypothetical protein
MQLIFLYGPAAAGKLTVGRALAARTGLPLFHNHLIVDALLAVFPFGSPEFVRLREQFWLEAFAAAATTGQSLIFTFAPEPTVAPDFPQRVAKLVASKGGRVDFIALTLDAAEQERRLVLASRAEYRKLDSVALLRELRAQFDACLAAMPVPDLTIDTEAMQPDAAAALIAERLALSS